MTEVWKPVYGFEGFYEVSSLGRVKTIPRASTPTKILSPAVDVSGRPRVTLSVLGKITNRSVSILVCEAFHGPRPKGHQAAHNDGRPANNTPENLRWATPKENNADKKAHGTEPMGERHPNAKLTDDLVREIRAHPEISDRAFAAKLGVCRATVNTVRTGKGWSHVGLLESQR